MSALPPRLRRWKTAPNNNHNQRRHSQNSNSNSSSRRERSSRELAASSGVSSSFASMNRFQTTEFGMEPSTNAFTPVTNGRSSASASLSSIPPPPPPATSSSSAAASFAARSRRDSITQTGAIPTLDLHGDQEAPAIRRVTNFLEENRDRIAVRIITGTGSHSHAGPVLRTAVAKLLEKRQMEFEHDTAGSFLVKGNTGITLYRAPEPEDTKVVLVRGNDNGDTAPPKKPRRHVSFASVPPVPPGGPAARHSTGALITAMAIPAHVTDSDDDDDDEEDSDPNRRRKSTGSMMVDDEKMPTATVRVVNWSEQPTPGEAADEDAILYQARELSIQTEVEENKKRRAVDNKDEVDRALRLSRRDFEQQQAEEQLLMEQALALSMRQQKEQEKEREQRGMTEEQFLIEQALALSVRQQREQEKERQQRGGASSKQGKTREEEEEELLLAKALEESKRSAEEMERQAAAEMERLMEEALRRSLSEVTYKEYEEERLMQKALAMSLRY